MYTPFILREPNGADAAAANRSTDESSVEARALNVRLATGLRAGTQNPPRMPYGTGLGPK